MKQVFVYGTLQRGGTAAELSGFAKDDSAPFPTIYPSDGDSVDGELITVSVRELVAMDHYEGFVQARPERSLYVRMQTADGIHVYVANVEQHRAWMSEYTLDDIEEQLATAEVTTE